LSLQHQAGTLQLEASLQREADLSSELALRTKGETEALNRAEATEEELVSVRSDCESFEAEVKWHVSEAARLAASHEKETTALQDTMREEREKYESCLEEQEASGRAAEAAWRLLQESLEEELHTREEELRASLEDREQKARRIERLEVQLEAKSKEVEAWEVKYQEKEQAHRKHRRLLGLKSIRHRVVIGIHRRQEDALRKWLRLCLAGAVAGRLAAERSNAKAVAESQRARFADYLFETRNDGVKRRLLQVGALAWGAEARERRTKRKHQNLICTKAMRAAWRLEATWGMNRARTVAVESSRARAQAESALNRHPAHCKAHC